MSNPFLFLSPAPMPAVLPGLAPIAGGALLDALSAPPSSVFASLVAQLTAGTPAPLPASEERTLPPPMVSAPNLERKALAIAAGSDFSAPLFAPQEEDPAASGEPPALLAAPAPLFPPLPALLPAAQMVPLVGEAIGFAAPSEDMSAAHAGESIPDSPLIPAALPPKPPVLGTPQLMAHKTAKAPAPSGSATPLALSRPTVQTEEPAPFFQTLHPSPLRQTDLVPPQEEGHPREAFLAPLPAEKGKKKEPGLPPINLPMARRETVDESPSSRPSFPLDPFLPLKKAPSSPRQDGLPLATVARAPGSDETILLHAPHPVKAESVTVKAENIPPVSFPPPALSASQNPEPSAPVALSPFPFPATRTVKMEPSREHGPKIRQAEVHAPMPSFLARPETPSPVSFLVHDPLPTPAAMPAEMGAVTSGEGGETLPLTALREAANSFPGSPPVLRPAAHPFSALTLPPLAAEILRHTAAGETRFQVRLQPAELGLVDVRIDFSDKGEARAHFTVERAETFDLFARDQRAIERALREAGFEARDGSVSINLRQDSGGERFTRQENGAHPQGQRPASSLPSPLSTPESQPPPEEPRRIARAGLLDIQL